MKNFILGLGIFIIAVGCWIVWNIANFISLFRKK